MDFAQKRELLLEKTGEQLREAVGTDILIIQSLASIDTITVQANHLSSRLREWAGYVVPEAERAVADNEQFSRLLATEEQGTILSSYVSGASMGKILEAQDWNALQSFAKHIVALYDERSSLLSYLESLLLEHAKNLHALLGTTITARLLANAGSLKRLATLPASTIQLLGAEKALFRHLKSGARSPKHGYIVNHQLVSQAKRNERGKIARALGDKAAICAKLDYFQGEFLGNMYLEDLQRRFRS